MLLSHSAKAFITCCLKKKLVHVICSCDMFTCSCDMNLTYYGMSTRHLITRVREHLDFNSIQRSAIKDHILSCDVCSDVQHGIKSFTVIKKCQSKFHTKIHEALLIKKDTPKLNRQLYAKGASFLLQVF